MKDGSAIAAHLPLVYPGSHRAEDVFACSAPRLTTFAPTAARPAGVGGKLLLVGDGAEVPLAECRLIELREDGPSLTLRARIETTPGSPRSLSLGNVQFAEGQHNAEADLVGRPLRWLRATSGAAAVGSKRVPRGCPA